MYQAADELGDAVYEDEAYFDSELVEEGLAQAAQARQSHLMHQNAWQATSGFEMCFAIGSRHLWCRFGAGDPNQNTSRIQIL